MTTPHALADLVAGRAVGPDGYVRLAVDASTWEALAAGCAAVAGVAVRCQHWAGVESLRSRGRADKIAESRCRLHPRL